MNKIFIASIIIFTLFSCKKTDEKMPTKDTTEDSLTTSKAIDDNINSNLIELSPVKMAEVLQAKKNDTLYVTNFFATWCAPCLQEIPHFKKKLDKLKNQPVKFTFVSLDNKTEWPTAVEDFAAKYDLKNNIVLLDGNLLDPNFFKQNFKTWGGESIPFTLLRKGDRSEEVIGSLTEDALNQKIDSFFTSDSSTK